MPEDTRPQTQADFHEFLRETVGKDVLAATEEREAALEGRPPVGATPPEQPKAAADPPAPAKKETQPGTPEPATTAAKPGEKLWLGKFKDEETAEKSYHLLIGNFNAVQRENDELKAKLAAAPAAAAPAPLSPGRADPSAAASEREARRAKFQETYGINPADLSAFVREETAELLEADRAPLKAAQDAETYMAETYPDYPAQSREIAAFVQANPRVAARVADEWNKGNLRSGLEIAYLTYDNARRALDLNAAARAEAASTNAPNDAARGHAALIPTQAGGSRETEVQAVLTEADMDRLRAEYKAGYGQNFRRLAIVPLLPPEIRNPTFD